MALPEPHTPPDAPLDDVELVERIAQHDHAAFEALMRRYNGRLFRVARAILKNDTDAEDVLQEGYLAAYRHIRTFRGGARLSTWLTRIVVNQALMRLRSDRREPVVVSFRGTSDDRSPEGLDVADNTAESAPQQLFRSELRRLLERRVDELPIPFRTVFVMREVEEMTVQETAECLSITPATVRTRLFRARALLRNGLANDVDAATGDLFGFGGERCDRIVAAVLARVSSTQD
jgi:RNA polymerase sigma-70 factor (ECF subfamily)